MRDAHHAGYIVAIKLISNALVVLKLNLVANFLKIENTKWDFLTHTILVANNAKPNLNVFVDIINFILVL